MNPVGAPPRERRPRPAAPLCLAALLLATAAAAQPRAPARAAQAPGPAAGAPVAPSLRGTQLLEPPRILVGDVAAVEAVVTTPPEHRVRLLVTPSDVPGLWILGSEALPVEREPARWVHRTRLRIRAREPGVFVWPAQRVEIEGPDGVVQSLDLDSLPVEVVSVLPEFPDRLTPFGLRAPPALPRARGGLLAPLAAGAALALAALALLALVRRERARSRPHAAPDPGLAPPWLEAQAALTAARGLADTDPRHAADEAARTLRRYVTRRFGASALARTTEELETAPAPASATSRWPALLALLCRLDALRFPPPATAGGGGGLATLVCDRIAEAEAFVAGSIPPEALR